MCALHRAGRVHNIQRATRMPYVTHGIAPSPWVPRCLLALCVVTQPTTVSHAIDKQLVHVHLPIRGDVEGHGTLPLTNRLFERWTGAFLNEELAPLINHLAAELRVT